MPELPEVETIKLYLEKAIVGQKIASVEILSKKQFLGNPKGLIGRKIKSLDRRAKYLIINLDNDKSLLIHLKLTGQLIWVPIASADLPSKAARIIIRFNKGVLFFNDRRKFGWIKVITNNKKLITDNLAKLGPEPLESEFSLDYLKKILQKTSRPIKLVLLDQEKIAGIGNIYANEALFLAKINPAKPAKNLTADEIKKLREAILKVLKQGIKYGGSSAADESYIKPDGSLGKFQQHFAVYQRQGQKCQRCEAIIKRINLSNRSTFFCPVCQK